MNTEHAKLDKLIQKALRNVSRLHGEKSLLFWTPRFEAIRQIGGADRKFARIVRVESVEQLRDYLVEIQYALVFVGLGFQVEAEPLAEKGPDLRISRRGHTCVVEIMRFRKIYSGPPELSLNDNDFLLKQYGNLPRDTKKALDKISGKFLQIGNDESIIAIWNDDGDMEEIEVEQAVRDLRLGAARQIYTLPRGLSFILYGSEWVGKKQFYCFPLATPVATHYLQWMQELENHTLKELLKRALAPQTKGD